MIKKYFLYLLLLSSDLFAAERMPSIGELRLRHRLGMLSAHEFAEGLADCQVMQFMDKILSVEEKNIPYVDIYRGSYNFYTIERKIDQISQEVLSRPSSLDFVLHRINSYANREFIKSSLCASLWVRNKDDLRTENILRYMVEKHHFNVDTYIIPLICVRGEDRIGRHRLGTVLGHAVAVGWVPGVALLLEIGARATIPTVHGALGSQAEEPRANALELVNWHMGFSLTPPEIMENYRQIRNLLQAAKAREQAQSSQTQS